MQLGIFAKTFTRSGIDDVFSAIAQNGLKQTQFNMACTGLPSMPEYITSELAEQVRLCAAKHDVSIAAVSGTFNMAHPDPAVRQKGLQNLRILAKACVGMGIPVITLCTGSRNADNMWKKHPDNSTAAAWHDLCRSMAEALEIAERYQIKLAIEPEVSNVVDDALKAKRLLEAMQSPNLKIIMDGANLIHPGQAGMMADTIKAAIHLLAEDIVIAHAKDLASDDGNAPAFCAAGQGIFDYGTYLKLLDECGYQGPLILHGLSELQVPESVRFIKEKLNQMQRKG